MQTVYLVWVYEGADAVLVPVLPVDLRVLAVPAGHCGVLPLQVAQLQGKSKNGDVKKSTYFSGVLCCGGGEGSTPTR